MTPTNRWYVAARSDQLGRQPLSRTVLGRPIVLYRPAADRVAVLEDRCPHKNVALSIGAVVGETLQCRYHGWRFDPAGACVEVPCHSPDERRPQCGIRAYPVVEQDGWIWVDLAEAGTPFAPPPRYPRDPRYGWFELHNVMDAPLDLILENGMDCSHTGFAHRGLFRSEPTRYATARIEETATGVRVETTEPPGETTRDVRSLLGLKREVRHVDELILPHTLRVDYWMGNLAHIVTILICTPEDDRHTRVYTRMGVYYRWVTGLMTRVVERVTRKVVAQDKAILESQAETIRRFGGRSFRAVVADQPATWIQRAIRRHPEGREPSETLRRREVVYKL